MSDDKNQLVEEQNPQDLTLEDEETMEPEGYTKTVPHDIRKEDKGKDDQKTIEPQESEEDEYM